MQNKRALLFPALSLCFLLLLVGIALGRASVKGIILSTQHPARLSDSPTAERGSDRALSPAPTAEADRGSRLDLNSATLEQLMELPGIGEVRARSILDYRAEHGPFRYPSDLLNVNGIGEATYEKLRDLVTVEERYENSDH